MLLELALRHLLGGRFSFFVRYRWKRWASAVVCLALTLAAGIGLAVKGYPFTGALAFVGFGLLFLVLRRFAHGPLPEAARGAYASSVTFIAVAGNALAVMTLIVVISVMDGFSIDIQKALMKTTAEVTILSYDENLDPRYVGRAAAVPGVVSADPFIEDDMMLRLDGGTRALPVRVRGELPERYARAGGPDLVVGSWSSLAEPGVAIVGSEIARVCHVEAGDSIWLVSSRGSITAMGVMPAMERFRIAGIFKSGFYEVDQGTVLIGLGAAQSMLGMDSAVSGIDVKGTDPSTAPQLKDKLEDSLVAPLMIRSWAETRESLYRAMQTEKIAMLIIESFLILIASFNISTTLLMAIGRKTRDIGLLMALGMSRGRILALFSLEGFLIGAVGSGMGAVAGTGLALYLKHFPLRMPGGGEVYYLDTLPVALSWGLVGVTVVFTLVLALAASLLPARSASLLAPAHALRVEA